MVDEILQILRESDSYAAAERVQREGSADEIAKRYSEVSRDLYWKKKDVAAAIAIGRYGIHHCLTLAKACDEVAAEQLRGVAKGMAFNLASFAWRGWDEKGIAITAGDVEAGRDAAKLNLRLAVELWRGAKPMMNAHWMIGAYHLADGEMAKAVVAFEIARGFAEQVGETTKMAMCRGYLALARTDEEDFAESVAALRRIGDKDSLFYAEQLETAKRVFGDDSKS
jgi:hypothetical protein